ncbi:MAG: outer membrane beta-barrel protein [Thermoguttaceae bacterium]
MHDHEPVTHTGMLGMYELADQLTLKAGIQRNWNQWEDTDGHDALGVLGGIHWASYDERKTLSWGITASEQGEDNNVVMYNLIGTWQMTERLEYAIVHDWGQSWGGHAHYFEEGEWYGISQYFYYELNPCWKAGARFEWFRDDDGTRVAGHGDGNATHHGEFEGNFYEATLGLNWTPTDNIRVRPEVRWDWFEGHDGGLHHRPYDAGDKNEQFLVGVDAIVLF